MPQPETEDNTNPGRMDTLSSPTIPNPMPNIHSKNTLKSPTQVAWEAMEAAKAKLIDDTKERLKEIREQVRRLENEECQLEDILRKQGR